jgi:alanyl-tRNA synthetase
MKSYEIRQRFLDFFKKRGHAIIESASLIPENDPSVLFNTAGMQPLVPYLMGQKHPLGNRLASCQKCVRTGDLDDIGDNRHFSFFEMLGNWSLGDSTSPDGIGQAGYFKDEAITWSYEFLTSHDEGLGLDPACLAVTIFQGDENAPYDQESKDIWMKLGIPEHRIYALGAEDNWWSPGDSGPCGPCTEIFYDMEGKCVGQEISHDDFLRLVQEEKFIEIWNDVFMEYEKQDGKVIGKLAQKNVDTGAGLERLTAVMQGKNTAYETDLLEPVMNLIKSNSLNYNERSARIVTDHIRTAVFISSDDVVPDSKDRGYILRRLIRRAVRFADELGILEQDISDITSEIMQMYNPVYGLVLMKGHIILDNIMNEVKKFRTTLAKGIKESQKIIGELEFNKIINQQEPVYLNGVSFFKEFPAKEAFKLYDTYGFPFELTEELCREQGFLIDSSEFEKLKREHQAKSRAGSEQKFKGGLGGTSEKIIRSHTAHHLLLAALRTVLGEHVHQRGSNITEERIRIDFSHDTKMTDEQKSAVEQLVNEWIISDLPVQRIEMPREEAEQIGAEMEFGIKYPDTVSVYFIGNNIEHAISKEFCGGPHVERTGLISSFKIHKEEASSAGIRRIKAVIE